MKALPTKQNSAGHYVACSVEEATHVTLNFPGPTGRLSLPIIRQGRREGTLNWTWNGSVDAPTLRPSVRAERDFICHSWVTDGKVQFLSDCTHNLVGQTVELLEVGEHAEADS